MIDFNTQVLGWDLETQGSLSEYALQPWRAREGKAWVSASAYTRGEASQGQLYPSTASIKAVLERAVAQNLYVCGWNTTFDVAWLCALGLQDLVFQIKWLDSMLLWRHLDVEPEGDDIPHNKRRSYKLETAMHEFFPDEAGFKEFTNFQTRDPEELQLLLFRCKEDTRFAVRLGEMFWHQLSAKQQQVALIEARCIPQVALANVNGIWSSREHAEALQVRLETDGAAVKEQLLSMCPDLEIVESGLKPKELKALQEQHPSSHFINLGSPLQLATLLFDIWGLPCLKQTKGTDKNPEGNRSTDKYVLYELAFQDPRAKMLKEVRECKNNCTKYAVATQKCLDYNGDGYIRPQARVFSTYSSRMTYSSDQSRKGDKELKTKKETFQIGVALHQWKRGKEFRRLIRVPQTFNIWSQPSDLVQESGVPAGYDMLELDFAGQEFRWMAVASRDETMLSLCAPGEDAHSYMGAQIAQMDYHELIRLVKEGGHEAEYQRKLGKFANLSFQYRVGPKTALQKARTDYEMDLDETFIKQILATYKATFPGIAGQPGQTGYWTQAIYRAKMAGYAETVAGRRVQLKGTWSGRDAWPMESTAINYPIQGTGADQKYLALAVARNMLPKYNAYFYYELHDGLFLIAPKDRSHKFGEVMLHTLSNLPYKQAWGVDLPIQLPVDCKISGESWGDLKNL